MKKSIITIIIAVLFLFAGYQIGHVVSKKKFDKELEEIATLYSEDIDATEDKYFDGINLNAENADIVDATGKHIDIRELGKPKNICTRFSATGCRPCIDTLTSSLQTFVMEHPQWHVNMIIDDIPLRDLYVLSKEFGPNFSLYSAANVTAELNDGPSPAVFRLSPEGTVYRHFACNPQYPERTKIYVSAIAVD